MLRRTWKVQACPKRMYIMGINGEGESMGQPANTRKMAVKKECALCMYAAQLTCFFLQNPVQSIQFTKHMF